MKYSWFRWTLLFPGLILILGGRCACAKPLDGKDIESLLPATPQTKNETVAAIVQDPIVKNAVQYAVGDGSLSGLVVKKNVVIIPANAPDQVLSHRQQILVAPTSHLEDIRKNITEDLQTETEEPQEFDQSELAVTYQSIAEKDANEKNETNYDTTLTEDPSITEDWNDTYDHLKDILPSIKPQVALPEGTVTQKLNVSKIIEKDVPVPVVAVLDPSKQTDEKIESSIVALLPNQPTTATDQFNVNYQLDYLENNRDEIRRDVQRFIDDSSLNIDSEIWKGVRAADAEIVTSSTAYDSSIRDLDDADVTSERLALPTIILLPREAGSPYVWNFNEEDYPPKDNDEDMSTAEDIVFRPLFRFRQEARRKADAYSDRRYNSYQSYDSYPRRRYRPRYSYDYY